ncbi:7847_t:CDS:2, partial [Acaulospora colombiana]
MGSLDSVSLNELPSIMVVALATYIAYFYYKYLTRENPLPGPLPLPLIGNLHYVLKNGIIHTMCNLREEYGEFFELYLGGERHICLSNEEMAKDTMTPKVHSNFHQRVDENCGLSEIGMLNRGIVFNISYNDWQYNRKFFSKALLSPSFPKHAVAAVQTGFVEMCGYWDQLGEESVIDFSIWMRRYFMDIIAITSSSKSTYALASFYNQVNKKANVIIPSPGESEKFINAIDFVKVILEWFIFFPAYIRNFPGPNLLSKKYKRTFSWLDDYILKAVEVRRAEIDATPEGRPLTPDILTMFLTVNTKKDITEGISDDAHDRPMTNEEVVGNYFEVMAGGINSGSSTICFLVYYVSHYPEVKQKLLKEFETVIGRNLDTQITIDHLDMLEYTEAVIKEAYRLFTTVPILIKRNENPAKLGDIAFPPNSTFLIDLQALHKHKSLWSNPEKFDPDRFLKSSPESKNSFYMFGSGSRMCPGRDLAMIELKATLLLLYSRYDVEPVDMKEPINFLDTGIRT